MSLPTQYTAVVGDLNSPSPGSTQTVDQYGGARVSARPPDYTAPQGVVGGYYRMGGSTSAVAFAASAILGNFRWSPSSPSALVAYLVRCTVNLQVVTAVTAQRVDPITLNPVRAYTANDGTSATAVTTSGNNGKMRTTPMVSSLVANIGFASAAAGISGGTGTQDSPPIGSMGLSGAAAIAGLGTGALSYDIYKCDIANGEHPFTMALNEGLRLIWGATALATGTAIVNAVFTWIEGPANLF